MKDIIKAILEFIGEHPFIAGILAFIASITLINIFEIVFLHKG